MSSAKIFLLLTHSVDRRITWFMKDLPYTQSLYLFLCFALGSIVTVSSSHFFLTSVTILCWLGQVVIKALPDRG